MTENNVRPRNRISRRMDILNRSTSSDMNNDSLSILNNDQQQRSVYVRKTIEGLTCCICEGLAHGYNFDAITCESCKAFFRRNALKANV
jgi:hypothetical protein